MTTTVVITKVAGIFAIVLIGFVASKLGWLPLNSSKYLSKLVLNIAAPCAVINSMATQEYDSNMPMVVLQMAIITTAVTICSWLLAVLICKILKIQKGDRAPYKNCLLFSNNGFMGFPVAFALFGSEGFLLMIMATMLTGVFIYTVGVKITVNDIEKDEYAPTKSILSNLKSLLNVPLCACFAGFIVYFLKIEFPVGLSDVMSTVGAMMTPLSMMVIGIQLTASSPKELIRNYKLTVMSFMRLIFIPAVVFFVLLPFNLSPLLLCVMTLSSALPCATVPVAIAEDYGGNVKLAAEGTFITTLFSVITLPIVGVLLTLYMYSI